MNTRILSRALRALTVSALTAGLALSSLADTYSWTKKTTGSYDWNAAANWSPNTGFPNAVGDVANITASATGYVTNALNQATVTVGILNIGDSGATTDYRRPFRIVPTTAGNALIFDNGSGPAEINQIATSNGDLVAAPVQIANALTVSSATPDRSLTISGAISGSGVTLTKAGLGEVLLTSANTFEGLLSVQAGRLVGTAQASGSPFGASTNALVIGGDDPLVANLAPTLALANPTPASTTSFGDLTAGGSFNSGYLAPGAAVSGTSYLQGEDLLRNAGATLVISPLTTTSLADTERILFSGSGTSLVNGIFPPWLVVGLNNGDFASYGANGIARATYTDTAFDQLLTTQVVNLAAAVSLAQAQTAYALRLGANLNLNGNALTLGDGTAGGLILLNNTTLSDSVGGGSLSFSSGELLAYVDGANAATISAPLSGSGVFRKFGTGTLTLTYPGLHNGDINLQAGTLFLNPAADFTYTGSFEGAGTLYKDGTSTILLPGASHALGGVWLKSGTVALSGASVTNFSRLNLAPTAQGTFPGATLRITNGSQWMQVGGAIIGNALHLSYLQARSNAVHVAGTGSQGQTALWDLGGDALIVGGVKDSTSKAEYNLLVVDADGVVTNAGLLALAYAQGGNYNAMVVTNGGKVYGKSAGIGGSSASNGGGSGNSVGVVGAGSLWSVGGGLAVGTTGGGSAAIGNTLLVSGAGAAVVDVTSLGVGYKLASSTSLVNENVLTVANGASLTSSGEAIIGGGYGGAARDNAVVVTGAGSQWQAGGDLSVNYGRQGPALRNALVVEQGGDVAGIARIYVGRANAQYAHEGGLVVTNGSSLASSGTVIVGYAFDQGSGLPAHSNRVVVAGGALGDASWTLGNADLYIGYAVQGADVNCNAFRNVVRIGRGGTISGIDDLFIGRIYNNPAYFDRTFGNGLELAGGSCTAATLTVYPNNAVAPIIGTEGLTPMTVSGTATFAAGSWIAPEATRDAPAGVYTVLTAASVVDNGLALSPDTDTAVWSLLVTPTDVKVCKRDPLTLLVVR